MSDIDQAEELNNRGLALSDAGDNKGATDAYRAAAVLAPDWSAPVYNLGLLYKYELQWQESFECNKIATQLAQDNEASWWNLGIAATALGEWAEARRAWTACGIAAPLGVGPPEFAWENTPVRLAPEGNAEVVWAKRLDPARAQIVSVSLPASTFHFGDVVLTDGAEEGQRTVNGCTYSVFNVLERRNFERMWLKPQRRSRTRLRRWRNRQVLWAVRWKTGVPSHLFFARSAVVVSPTNMLTRRRIRRIRIGDWRRGTMTTQNRSSTTGCRTLLVQI